MLIGHSAPEHHQVDAVGKPFVTKRREFEEVSPKSLECLYGVRKITAECFVLGVGHTKSAMSATTTWLIRFQPRSG